MSGLFDRLLPLGTVAFLVGLAGLGCLSLLSADFAYQWQPVPADVPARETWARVSGFILVNLALSAAVPDFRARAFAGLAVFLGGWVVLTHGPAVAARPASVGAWLGVAEIGALFAAAAAMSTPLSGNQIGWATLWRRLLGLAAIFFGVAHFAYPDITAGMVPRWIPWPTFWAYATGLGHLVGGIALLVGVVPVLAAALLGCMYLSWVLILHLPRVIADAGNRVEWTMLFVALALAGAAFLIAWCASRRTGPMPIAD